MNSINEIILLSGSKFPKMNCNKFWRSVKNLRGFPIFEPQFRCVKTRPQKSKKENPDLVLELNKKKNFFSRTLSREDWQNIESVTAVSVAFNIVSWSTVSLPRFQLINWDHYALPSSDPKEMLDTLLIRTAFEVKEKLPISDLYVMETEPTKLKQITGMSFRYFLVMLLATQNGTLENSKLILQKRSVLNSLTNLVVGGERTSSKDVVFNKFMEGSQMDGKESDPMDPFSLLKLEKETLCNFSLLSEHKQESLAIALLMNLSFLNLAYLQNPNTIARISRSQSIKR